MRRGRLRRLAQGIVLGLLACGVLPPSHAQEWQAALEAGDYELAYQRARALGLAGETEAALAGFDALLARFPDDADYLLGRAQMLARLGRNAAAIETAERALTLAPAYEDVWQLRLQLAERSGDETATAALRAEAAARFPDASWWRAAPAPVEYHRWVSAGWGGDRLSNDAPDWNQQFLRLDWETPSAASVFAEISESERFGESDASLLVGGSWTAFTAWRLGAALAVTADAGFLPEQELALDATRAWADGFGTAFGFRQRDYPSDSVSTYSITGDKYVANFRIAYRLDHSTLSGAGSALTHALIFAWYPSDGRSLGITLGAGEEIEKIDLDQLLSTSVANLTFSGSETLSPRFSLNWWLGTHEQGDFYRRNYAGLSLRIGF